LLAQPFRVGQREALALVALVDLSEAIQAGEAAEVVVVLAL
jgi:hypothetical protein